MSQERMSPLGMKDEEFCKARAQGKLQTSARSFPRAPCKSRAVPGGKPGLSAVAKLGWLLVSLGHLLDLSGGAATTSLLLLSAVGDFP